jgi:hypothetical protein
MTDRTCQHCGEPVTRNPKRGPQPKYCSDLCKARASRAVQASDGRHAAYLAAQSARRAAERAANARPCPYCGAPMTSPRRKQCGAPDCERRFNVERNAVYAREIRERTGDWPARTQYEHTCEACGKTWTSRDRGARFCSGACANSVRTWAKTCETCGFQWTAKAPTARFCSPRCDALASRASRSQVVLRPGGRERRAFVPVVLPPLRKRWYAGFCAECGTAFIHDQPQTITCTDACSRRWYGRRDKDKRRAVKKAAFVENVYRKKIFERDRWRCQLCRKPVARTKSVPHPKAPVLDHIIPLAEGGTNEPANVQCAHFLCNSKKGARGAGEQLLLIG